MSLKHKRPSARATNTRSKAQTNDMLPLDFMLAVLRDKDASIEDRKWAAYHAAPFCHPRLSTVDHTGDVTIRHEDALKELA